MINSMVKEFNTINRVFITPEAEFDYDDMFSTPLPSASLKSEVEEYIGYMQVNKYFRYYFRCVWYDKLSGKDLMLFFYKNEHSQSLQVWDLVGICETSDWSEELENNGYIRNWLLTKITDIDVNYDWVVEYRKQLSENNPLSTK